MALEKETGRNRNAPTIAKSRVGRKYHTVVPKSVAETMDLDEGYICFVDIEGIIALAKPDLAGIRGNVYGLEANIRAYIRERYVAAIELMDRPAYSDRDYLERVAEEHPLVSDPIPWLQSLENYYGLVARHKITGKANKDDAKLTSNIIASIVSSQRQNGSWEELIVTTSSQLIKLSSLGLTADSEPVGKGAEWLLSNIKRSSRSIRCLLISPNDPWLEEQRYVELNPQARSFKSQKGVACFGSSYVPTAMALRALGELGFHSEAPVKQLFDAVIRGQDREVGGWCACSSEPGKGAGMRCTAAFLEALSGHCELRNSESAEFALEYFRNFQRADGTWGGGLFSCFYHILDFVSRFDHPAALEQTVKALPHIVVKQRKDGTWGSKYRDLNTLTVVSALHRQRLLDLVRPGPND